jgi:hypothetical protein
MSLVLFAPLEFGNMTPLDQNEGDMDTSYSTPHSLDTSLYGIMALPSLCAFILTCYAIPFESTIMFRYVPTNNVRNATSYSGYSW